MVFHFNGEQTLGDILRDYMEPLKHESFLSENEYSSLFGNLPEIYAFQSQFLQNLEEALDLEPDLNTYEHISQFKVTVL